MVNLVHRIEKIGENTIYVKATRILDVAEAEKFVKEFEEFTENMEQFSVIVDLLDTTALKVGAIDIILDLLRNNNARLLKSSFAICCNPVLSKEFEILIERAESEHRKITGSLDEAKEWLGISEIVIEKDYGL